jgi:hypothetical protein
VCALLPVPTLGQPTAALMTTPPNHDLLSAPAHVSRHTQTGCFLCSYYEAELLHARWAMLGAIGCVIPEVCVGRGGEEEVPKLGTCHCSCTACRLPRVSACSGWRSAQFKALSRIRRIHGTHAHAQVRVLVCAALEQRCARGPTLCTVFRCWLCGVLSWVSRCGGRWAPPSCRATSPSTGGCWGHTVGSHCVTRSASPAVAAGVDLWPCPVPASPHSAEQPP